jgi:hypothetical protein
MTAILHRSGRMAMRSAVRRDCLDRMLIFGEAHLRRKFCGCTPAITMKRALTYRCARMRRWVERFNDTEPLSPCLFWRACIIGTLGYDFRKGQA